MTEIFRSKFFKITASALLLLVLVFLGKELQKRYQIRKEIRDLENEIASLETKNRDTLDLIGYFKTVEYQERQARQLLNLQKPGEFMVALPIQEQEKSLEGKDDQPAQSNLIKWWNYFFTAPR